MARRARGDTSLTDKAGVVVFSRILSTLVDLATIIILVRLLSKDAVAVVGFLLLVYQTVRYFAAFGFPESVFYFFEKLAPEHRRAFSVRTVAILTVLGAAAALGLAGLSMTAPYVLRNWNAEQLDVLQRLLPWLGLVALLEIPTTPMNNILLAMDRQKASSWYQIVTSVGLFAALAVPVALGLGADAIVYTLVAFSVVRFVVTAVWFQAVLPGPGTTLPPGTTRDQIRFSVPLGLNAFSGRIGKYLDRFVVSTLLPAAAFAEYQVGGQELPIVTAIPGAVASVLITRYVSLRLAGDREGLLALWNSGIEGVSLIVVPVAMLFIAIGHDFITLVFGAEYAPAVVPFQIYTVILFHRVTIYGALLQAHDDTGSILRFTLLNLAANAGLSVPLTLLVGLPGAALASLLSAMMTWYMYLRHIARHLDVGLGQVFPWRYYLRVLAISAVAGAACWVLRVSALASLPQVVAMSIAVAVFVALYAGLGTLTRVIDRSHWVTLGNWLRLRFLWN
ncbi:MAG TPA: oligosaccharide flippase family protein [Haliangium sp.]|nr:oligosaccharide flippase family protein [Haliangium sp.]